jgi:hypothetical protein
MMFNIMKNIIKILRIELLHHKRCENCRKWLTSECSEFHYGAAGPLGKCSEWEKKTNE